MKQLLKNIGLIFALTLLITLLFFGITILINYILDLNLNLDSEIILITKYSDDIIIKYLLEILSFLPFALPIAVFLFVQIYIPKLETKENYVSYFKIFISILSIIIIVLGSTIFFKEYFIPQTVSNNYFVKEFTENKSIVDNYRRQININDNIKNDFINILDSIILYNYAKAEKLIKNEQNEVKKHIVYNSLNRLLNYFREEEKRIIKETEPKIPNIKEGIAFIKNRELNKAKSFFFEKILITKHAKYFYDKLETALIYKENDILTKDNERLNILKNHFFIIFKDYFNAYLFFNLTQDFFIDTDLITNYVSYIENIIINRYNLSPNTDLINLYPQFTKLVIVDDFIFPDNSSKALSSIFIGKFYTGLQNDDININIMSDIVVVSDNRNEIYPDGILSDKIQLMIYNSLRNDEKFSHKLSYNTDFFVKFTLMMKTNIGINLLDYFVINSRATSKYISFQAQQIFVNRISTYIILFLFPMLFFIWGLITKTRVISLKKKKILSNILTTIFSLIFIPLFIYLIKQIIDILFSAII